MNKKTTQAKIASMAAATMLLGNSIGSAAVITWGSATDVATTTDVLNAGTTVEAFNMGYQATGLSAVTVNGVSFTTSVQPSPLTLTNTDPYGQLSGSTSGDADYDNLLNSVAYGGGTSASMTIGGGGLVSGQLYQLQVWFVDERAANSASSRVMTYGDGNGNTVDLGGTAGNLGQYATGTFTANDVSQELILATNEFGNSHITAYQLRQIPEPSSAILAGLGGMMLLRRRRS